MMHTAGMRVVFAVTSLDVGGAEQALVDIVTHLSRDRFDPYVVSLSGPPPPGHDCLVARLKTHRIPVHFLGARHPVQALSTVMRLMRLLRKIRPTVLQTFLWHANTAGAMAAKLARVPHVVTGIRVAERRANTHRRITRWTGKWADRHVCVSHAVADFMTRHAGLQPASVVVIPTGVDVPAFEAVEPVRLEDLGVRPGRRALVVAGRLERQKGIDWLLKLAPDLLETLADHDLLVMGKGPLQRDLERQVRASGSAGRIVLLGWRSDAAAVIAACDLLLVASRWEGLPRVVLEAMALGRPVVAVDAEGVDELLGSDHGGQVVRGHDRETFHKAVAAIAGDPRRAAQLGRRNHARVVQQFGIRRCVDAYERLYQSLAAAPRAGGGA